MYLNPAVPVKATEPHISASTGDTHSSSRQKTETIQIIIKLEALIKHILSLWPKKHF